MELAYKEELFFMLSPHLTTEEAVAETERIANNFKNMYSPKPFTLQPIRGDGTYRYFLHYLENWGEYTSRIDKYEDGKWVKFMSFIGVEGGWKCESLIKRLEMGGNTVIEF